MAKKAKAASSKTAAKAPGRGVTHIDKALIQQAKIVGTHDGKHLYDVLEDLLRPALAREITRVGAALSAA